MLLKGESQRCADKAREEWWKTKAAEAEQLHESAVRLGYIQWFLTEGPVTPAKESEAQE